MNEIQQQADPQDEQIGQLFNETMAHVSDYLHGDAMDQVIKQLSVPPEKLEDAMSAIAYRVTVDAVKAIERSLQTNEIDIELALMVAAETIDMLMDVAERVNRVDNPDDLREKALMGVSMLHMEQVGDDPDQKAIAQDMLAQYAESGDFEESMAYVQQRERETSGQQPTQQPGLLGAV